MRHIENMAAQGDLLVRRIDALPEGITACAGTQGVHVVAHSETGHHHTVTSSGVQYYPVDELLAYLDVQAQEVSLEHHRAFDTHEALSIPRGTYELRRQREYTPEGWRRVED